MIWRRENQRYSSYPTDREYFSEILSYVEAFNMVTAGGTATDLQQTRNEISGYSKSVVTA